MDAFTKQLKCTTVSVNINISSWGVYLVTIFCDWVIPRGNKWILVCAFFLISIAIEAYSLLLSYQSTRPVCVLTLVSCLVIRMLLLLLLPSFWTLKALFLWWQPLWTRDIRFLVNPVVWRPHQLSLGDIHHYSEELRVAFDGRVSAHCWMCIS